MPIAKSSHADTKLLCDDIRKSFKKIRHLGYYNRFGRILYDSLRDKLVPLEEEEERHILNGTVASTLAVWNGSNHLLGTLQAFVMIREKLLVLVVPIQQSSGNYLLVGFDKDTKISYVEKIRSTIMKRLL